MNWLIRQFGAGFARKLGFMLAVAVVGVFASMGSARAHEGTAHSSQSEAYQHCMTMAGSGTPTSAYYDYVCYPQTANEGSIHSSLSLSYYTSCGVNKRNPSVDGQYVSTSWGVANCRQSSKNFYFVKTGECPNGWNETEKKCFPSTAECLAKNDSLGSSIAISDTDTNGCDQGCAMSMGTDYERSEFTANGITRTLFQGKMRYTGASCSTSPTKPPNDPAPACQQIEGMTVCKQDDGKLCYSIPDKPATSHCWFPGETGEKNEGPHKQVTGPGTNPPAPNPQLPSGDTLVPVPNAPPITSTTTPPAGGGPPRTTTTNNFTTNFGSNAGPGPGTGTPTGEDAGDGEDGDKNGLTGDPNNCDEQFTTSGDPVIGAVLGQIQKLRCMGKKDGDSATSDTQTLGDLADAMEPGEGESIFGEGDAGTGLTDTWYSFGGGACPNLTFDLGEYGSATAPPEFCDLIAALAMLFQLLAYVWAMRIVME